MGWKNSRDNSPKEKIKIGFSKEMKISVVEISFNLFYIHRAYATKNNLIKLFTHFTFLNEIFFHFRWFDKIFFVKITFIYIREQIFCARIRQTKNYFSSSINVAVLGQTKTEENFTQKASKTEKRNVN